MTQKTKVAVTLLLLTLLLAGTASAASIVVNTDGLVGKTTDTTLVPVEVIGANDIVAWQFTLKTQNDETAKIVFNTDSVKNAGATSGEKVVFWYDPYDDPSGHIFGDKKLIYIAVTPQVQGTIPIEIYNVRIYETTGAYAANYTVVNGSLLVNGTGSNITVGDSDSGATILFGITDEEGTWITGEDVGLVKVEVPNYPETEVYVYTGSSGPYPIPETLKYFYNDEVYTKSPAGEEYYITYAVSADDLLNAGENYKVEDLFVLHNVNGVWYETNLMSTEVIDGIVYVKVKTWSAGPFILGYDKNGVNYPKETKDTALKPSGGGAGVSIDPMMLAIGGAILVGAAVLIFIIILVKRRKNDDEEDELVGKMN